MRLEYIGVLCAGRFESTSGRAIALAADDARSDQRLIAAAQSGDQQAFHALYLRYRDWVLQVAYRFTGHREDALDVVQETFTYLVRKLPELTLTAKLTTFLYPVVKHQAGQMRRKRRPLTVERLPDPPTEADSIAPSPQRDELAALMAVFTPRAA